MNVVKGFFAWLFLHTVRELQSFWLGLTTMRALYPRVQRNKRRHKKPKLGRKRH